MKRVCLFLLAGLLAASCGPGRFDPLKVNLDRALKHPAGARDVYTEATAIPLRCPKEIDLGRELKLLDVAPDRFVLLDAGKNEILLFDGDGRFVTTVWRAETILDGSVYRDQVLEVLTEDAILEYSTADGAFLAAYPIRDRDVVWKSVARVTENGISMIGTRDGTAYGGGYLIDRDYYYSEAWHAPDYLISRAHLPADEVENSRFFRCGDTVYSFLSRSGQIDKYSEDYFVCVPYQWDFGRRHPVFTNVQKTADRLYLAFELEEERAVLIYDLKSHRYKSVLQSEFPLGIIYDGCNYALAHGTLQRYALR